MFQMMPGKTIWFNNQANNGAVAANERFVRMVGAQS
jgi:hypothetical protein